MGLLDDNARITSGRILYDGIDLLGLSDAELRDFRGNRIAMIFQDPSTALNPLFTVGDQIMNVLRAHRATPAAES